MSERLSIYERLGRDSITETAAKAVFGDREREYGGCLANLERTAQLWEPILGVPVTAEAVCLCMIALKVARLCYQIGHRDSLVDVAGWAEVLGMCVAERELADTSDVAEAEPAESFPDCPGCGKPSPTCTRTMQTIAAQELAVRCIHCGRISPAKEWVEGREDAAASSEG